MSDKFPGELTQEQLDLAVALIEADLEERQQQSTEIDTEDAKSSKPNAATILVAIAQSKYAFGCTTAGEPYAVPVKGPRIPKMLRGGRASLGAELRREYFKETQRAPSGQAVADALGVIEGFALEMAPTELWTRVSEHDQELWLDLGNETGRAVRITDEGWTVEESSPVRFRRTALTGALPEPMPGGDLNELWDRLNIGSEDRPLVEAWLVSTLLPDIPHPILGLFGQQGTGKSTAARLLSLLTDPSPVPNRKPPKDLEAWVTAAQGSWVVSIDNLSWIPDWLSDSLCRAVTGDGDVRRKLYSDGDLVVFNFRRCLILNGIDVGAFRGDLADRMLVCNLQPVSEQDRLTESEFWVDWRKIHPMLLGAILTRVSQVKQILHSVHLELKPRMADFARVLAAVDRLSETDGLGRYMGMQSRLAEDSLGADPFIAALRSKIRQEWTGTSAELLKHVTEWTPSGVLDTEPRPRGWPKHAKQVTGVLRRQGPSLERLGWKVTDDDAHNHDGVIRWSITPPRDGGAGNPSPPPPLTRDQGGDAGQEGIESGHVIPRCVCGERLIHPKSIERGSCYRCDLAVKEGGS